MFSQCAVAAEASALSSIVDWPQQQGEGCDGRPVQPSPSDGSRLERCSMFLQRVLFLVVEGEECLSLDTCVAGVGPSANEIALVMRFLRAAAV